MFSGSFGHIPEYRGVTGTPPGRLMGLLGPNGEEEGRPKWGRSPSPIRIGRGAGPPFLLSLSLFLLLLLQLGKGGNLLLPGVGLLLFLLGEGEGRKRKEGGRKGGRPPPNSDWAWGGSPSLAPFPSFPLKPIKAHIPPGGFR